MKNYLAKMLLLVSAIAAVTALANGQSNDNSFGINREVRHELVMLPNYSVFDIISYEVKANTVTLMGEVTKPTLKSDAEKTVQRIEGVDNVINNIEVLPLSTADETIRVAAYRALFNGDSPLMRYGLGSVPPIHIIVKNGKITLVGAVANEGDKALAASRVNGIPGTFGVTNNLMVSSQ